MKNHHKQKSSVSLKLAVTAMGLAGAILLSGCGSPEASTDSSATTETTSSTPSATPSVSETPKPQGKRIDTPKGSYIQVTFSDAYPNYQLDPEIIEEGTTATFTDEEIQSAKKFVMDFIITEGINSKANTGGQTLTDWMVEHEALFSPDWYAQLLNEAKEGNQIILGGGWTQNYPGYEYVYGENETRHTNIAVIPTAISTVSGTTESGTPSTGLAISSDVSFNSNVISPEGVTSQTATTGIMRYSVVRDGKGGWLLSGYNHEI